MEVREIMTPVVSCVKPETTLTQAAVQMKKENVGSLPVCNDKGELLGIVTDRDIVVRAVAGTSEKSKVQEIMTTNIVSAHPSLNTHDAALLMSKYQVRRLPVLQGSKLVGMLSLADIARKTAFIDEAGDILNAVSRIGSFR